MLFDFENRSTDVGIYDVDFIAANQAERANNVITGTKSEQIEVIRKDLRDFKEKHSLDKIIVLWTANTERYAAITEGINDTAGKCFCIQNQV